MASANKVVIRYKDGGLVKGTTHDFNPAKPSFHIHPPDSDEAVEARVEDLKAVFFVKTLEGNREYEEVKALPDGVPVSKGKRIVVIFHDGELITGYTHSYSSASPGFFIVPADPRSNNLRIYVVRSSAKEVALGVRADELLKRSVPT